MRIAYRPLLLTCLLMAGPAWGDASATGCAQETPCTASDPQLDPIELEKGLQSLSWEQLVQIFLAVPKLKEQYERLSDFERSILQQRYARHAWRRNVAKLDEGQRMQLAELIGKFKAGAAGTHQAQ